MGGSSAQPNDISGKYRPNKAALESAKLINILLAGTELKRLRNWSLARRQESSELERKYGMDIIAGIEDSLHKQPRSRNLSKIRELLRRMKIVINKDGYSVEFENDLTIVESIIRKMRAERMAVYAGLQGETTWRCTACGSNSHKLIDGKRQCQMCYWRENE